MYNDDEGGMAYLMLTRLGVINHLRGITIAGPERGVIEFTLHTVWIPIPVVSFTVTKTTPGTVEL